jgi:hypothetical protein
MQFTAFSCTLLHSTKNRKESKFTPKLSFCLYLLYIKLRTCFTKLKLAFMTKIKSNFLDFVRIDMKSLDIKAWSWSQWDINSFLYAEPY